MSGLSDWCFHGLHASCTFQNCGDTCHESPAQQGEAAAAVCENGRTQRKPGRANEPGFLATISTQPKGA